jgi:DNA-binding MarR family transcriptional regulator
MQAPAPERRDFGILLALSYVAFVDELRAELARAGFEDLHNSFGYVARALAERPRTLRELADLLELTSQGALKIVDAMERDGYLERRPDPNDGRAKLLRLSARGRAALATARRFHRRFERELAAELGAPSVAVLREALEAVVKKRERSGASVKLRSP